MLTRFSLCIRKKEKNKSWWRWDLIASRFLLSFPYFFLFHEYSYPPIGLPPPFLARGNAAILGSLENSLAISFEFYPLHSSNSTISPSNWEGGMLPNHFLYVKSNIGRVKWVKSQQRNLVLFFFEVTRWRYFRRRSEYSQKRPPSTDLVDRAIRTPATTVLYECGAQFLLVEFPRVCVYVCNNIFPIFAVSLFGETKVARTTVFVCVFVYLCANRVGLFWWNVQGRWNKKRNNASSRASFLRHGSNTTVRKRRRPGEFSLDNFPSKGVFFLFFFLGSSCGPRHPLVSHPLAALFEKWFFIMYGSPLSHWS